MKLEDLIITLEAVRNLGNLRKDIASNVADYKRRVARGEDPASVQAVINADLSEYQRRLAWHDEPDVKAEISAGVSALGIEDFDAEFAELSSVVQSLVETPKSSKQEIEALEVESATRKTLFKPKNG